MAKINVDGVAYEVNGGDNLLQACLQLGLDIPYFCWHPALDSVGACRECAIKQYKDADDKNGRIVMSCMTPVTDNTYISIADAEATEFREAIVAFLMTNHPHDCPVCEEGGHCHLQDMTVMIGHHARDYRFTKRTHQNQDLGPFISHEMNRCIACYRCTRFYKDYAGGKDLGVYGTAANVYFGREKPGTLENEFSGNLTEVCPTGVFTDKTHSEKYTRKWDMQFAPSVCTGCAVGCNISPGERYGEIRRIENRYHGELNGYFLCDRGRFGYGYVNRKDRPRHALARHGASMHRLERAEAVNEAALLVKSGKPLLGIGSPRASLEANIALRNLVGAENFYAGVNEQESALVALVLKVLRTGPVPAATIRRIEESDAVLVLGEDTLATAPRVALALRQAARGKLDTMCQEKRVPEWQAQSAADIAQHALNPLFVATPAATKLDEIAAATARLGPVQLAALGNAVAAALDAGAPAADTRGLPDGLVAQVADALKAAKRPLIVSGTGTGSTAVIAAAANLAWALHKLNAETALSLAVPEVNSQGLGLLEAPTLEAAFARAAGEDCIVVVLENDLTRRLPAALVQQGLARATVIALDHQQTPTTDAAVLVLPAATFAEGDGSYVNFEGRAQRAFQVFDPAYYDRHVGTQESWRWLGEIAAASGRQAHLSFTLDDAVAACEAMPQFAGVAAAAPGADFRLNGGKLARAPHRQSGRTAARADVFVHEPKATPDPDTALTFSMEGVNSTHNVQRPAALIPFAWAPGWSSPSAWNKFQAEIGGAMKGGDSGVRLYAHNGKADYLPVAAVGDAFAAPARDGTLRVLPVRAHFGSEEMSSRAEPIQQRMTAPTLMLSLADAGKLGLAHQSNATLEIEGQPSVNLPVRVRMDFPAGCVGVPVGMPGVPVAVAGAAVRLTAAPAIDAGTSSL